MRALKFHEWQAQYQRQHGTKLRYEKKSAAAVVAAVMEEKSGVPQHSYRCKFCGGWHNGRDWSRD